MKFKDLSLNKIADVAELVHAADCKSADERSNRSFGSVSLKFDVSSLKVAKFDLGALLIYFLKKGFYTEGSFFSLYFQV
jgi:hypothetical protein